MRNKVAIVKATYTKKADGAKASVRYIEHRPGKDGAKITRPLFGRDGVQERQEAYRMIDEAEKGSIFYRFVISPDAKTEDTRRDLTLRAVTEKTIQSLEERTGKQVTWIAAEHNDHAPHRHIHLVAIVPGKLQVQDLQTLRQTATTASKEQRRELDLAAQHRQQEQDRDENQLGLERTYKNI